MHIEEDYMNTPTERANMDYFIEESRKKALANNIPNHSDVEKRLDICWFTEKKDGKKTWEIRIEDDHVFKVGDIVKYREWNPVKKYYTGRFLIVKVISVIRNISGLERGYCLMIDENIAQGGLIS